MSAGDQWNPDKYEQFSAEREQPFWDLVGLIQARGMRRVVDLGCGTGKLTAALHRELQSVETVGADSSPAMLERAAALAVPGLRFERVDIVDWEPRERFDVVFSNAALQWVPDHEHVFAQLTRVVAPGGELAVQMPANFDHPSHALAAETALEEPFATALGGHARVVPVLSPEAYAQLLHGLGFARQSVRMQVYGHVLESTDAVVDWVRGTLLTDYEVRMPATVFEEFVARYRERLLAILGDERPYFYAFKRLLIWGLMSQP